MANSIKYWREKRKVSQVELAEKVGIDRPMLSKIESESVPVDPDDRLALKIARELNVLVTDILRK